MCIHMCIYIHTHIYLFCILIGLELRGRHDWNGSLEKRRVMSCRHGFLGFRV